MQRHSNSSSGSDNGSGSGQGSRFSYPAGREDFEGRSRSRGAYLDDRGDQYGRGGRGHHTDHPSRGQYGGGGFSKKPLVASFAQGSSCNLHSNHFKFGIRTQGYISMYEVDFGQFITFQHQRSEAMRTIKQDLSKILGLHIGYGKYLFALELQPEPFSLSVEYGGQLHEMKINFVQKFNLEEHEQEIKDHKDKVLNFVLTIVKRTLLEKDYRQVGRLPKFFNPKEQREIRGEGLMIWPGYTCEVMCLNDGFFLNVDTATKFINKRTVLEMFIELKKQKQLFCCRLFHNRYSNEEIVRMFVPQGEITKNNQRLVVITMYNCRTYMIDDITFSLNPKNYEFEWEHEDKETKIKKKVKTNMIEYFKIKYGIQIGEESQPLLVNHHKDQIMYFPPSLCYEASLPKNFTRDSKRMRNIDSFKIKDPLERYERIGKIIGQIEQETILQEWNLKLHPNFAQVKARVLYQPKILLGQDEARDFHDFETNAVKLANPITLDNEKWAIVYSKASFNRANNLLEMIQKAQNQMGMKLVDPQWVEIPYVLSPEDYCVAIESDIDPKYTEMAIVILEQREHKPLIKKLLDKMGIPSQFVTHSIFDKNKLGIYTNLLRQINSKLKGDLYKLQVNTLKRTMIIGIDLVNVKSGRYIGLTASYNQNLSQFYSAMVPQEFPKASQGQRMTKDEQEERITQKRTLIIQEFMKEALMNYQEHSRGNLPEQIIVYRDGIGGPTLMEKVLSSEVQSIVAYLETYVQSYHPKLIYCFIDKNIDHRLFSKNNGDCYNPGPGTVVDSSLVENQGDKQFDFFMIPHKATIATARPVHYKVVYNTSELNKEQIETCTYHLCYNYFGFGGPIKVPNACKYAEKLAAYCNENDISNPNPSLSQNLHYL